MSSPKNRIQCLGQTTGIRVVWSTIPTINNHTYMRIQSIW
jgi:hypothetical protein